MHDLTKVDSERGARIRAARSRHFDYATDQTAAAKALDVSRATLSGWENGKPVRIRNLQKVAEVFGVTVGWLAGDAGAEPFPGPPLADSKPAPESATSQNDMGLSAAPVLEMLDRSESMRRFAGHIGIGSRLAMALDYAEREEWGRADLIEALRYAAKWGREAERTIDRLYHQLRNGDRSEDRDLDADVS